ncbi:hypothetical protein BH10ACT2_BH10ACT2_12500 [soil metagenome]
MAAVHRWPVAVALLAAAFAATPAHAQLSADDAPTADFVQTSEDSFVDAEAWAAGADYAASEATSNGPFQPVFTEAGFTTFGERSYGDYIVRLATSTAGNIEDFRVEAQQLVNEVNASNGVSLQLAAATAAGPTDPLMLGQVTPLGEIWLMISSQSPCGVLSTQSGILGCGGPTGGAVVDGIYRWTEGAVYLQPGMAAGFQQAVTSHEIGHALGLAHFDGVFEGHTQVMKSSTNGSYIGLQSGDLNGVHWLSNTPPGNDSVASASRVCPGDSSVAADTWFATAEPSEQAHAGAPARRSVWYRYVPRSEQNGLPATITTRDDGTDDFNTVMAVYTGAISPAIPLVSDNGASPGNISQVSFNVDKDLIYWIAIDGVGFARGETDVEFDLPDIAGDLVQLCAPARMLDTRAGGTTIDHANEGVGRIQAGQTYQLPIAGRADVPPTAASVVLNVTAVSPSSNGFVTVFPCGQPRPTASNLNFVAGLVVPNMVVARVGTVGQVCLYSSAQTDLLVDVSGYFPASDALVPLAAPGRLLDTRAGGATIDGQHQGVGQIQAGATYELPVLDRAGIDVAAAETVVLNVTAVSPIGKGFVTVFPCGQPRPNASNLNFTPGKVIANAVLARVGDAGRVCLYSSVTTDLLVDVSGSFPTTDVLTPLTAPQRILDSRIGGSTADGQHQGLGLIPAGTTYQLPIAGRVGVPANVVAVVLNVTVVQPSSNGFVTVFACGQDRPTASNLNFKAGDVIPNAVITSLGTGGNVCIFSSAGTDLLVDVSGYFP